MKTLSLLIAFLALVGSASAQTTNVVITRQIAELDATGTNVTRNHFFTNSLSARQVEGLNVLWAKDLMVAQQLTNPAPSFRASANQNLNDMLKTLADIARADDVRKNAANEVSELLAPNWDNLSRAQKQYLSTNILPALKGQ